MSFRSLTASLAFAFAAAPAVVSAQAEFTTSIDVNSQFTARGLTATNRSVVQPDLALTVPVRGGSLTFGAWGNIEGGRYNDPQRHLSENGGQGGDLAEYDLRLEGAHRVGRADLTLGLMTYTFPNALGTTRESNTVETYAVVGFDAPFSPSLSVWYDVRKIQGAYGEAALSHDVGPLSLGVTAGVNFGQSVGDGGPLGYYERAGLTHVEFSAEHEWTVGAVSVAPSAHLVLARDEAARVAAPGVSSRTKFWFGTSFGWTGRAMPARRQVAEASAEPETAKK